MTFQSKPVYSKFYQMSTTACYYIGLSGGKPKVSSPIFAMFASLSTFLFFSFFLGFPPAGGGGGAEPRSGETYAVCTLIMGAAMLL